MRLVILAILIFSSSLAFAFAKKSVYIEDGFFTGQKYLDFDDSDKAMYVSGIFDGIYASPILDANQGDIKKIKNCTVGMNNVQLAAIFTKYLQDNPEVWNQSMSITVMNKLNLMCHLAGK